MIAKVGQDGVRRLQIGIGQVGGIGGSIGHRSFSGMEDSPAILRRPDPFQTPSRTREKLGLAMLMKADSVHRSACVLGASAFAVTEFGLSTLAWW